MSKFIKSAVHYAIVASVAAGIAVAAGRIIYQADQAQVRLQSHVAASQPTYSAAIEAAQSEVVGRLSAEMDQ